MRTINADEFMELYENTDELNIDNCKVPIPVIRQNILDMPILDSIVFPQTIGSITYYSSEDLIEWVKNQQQLNIKQLKNKILRGINK